TSLQKTQDKYYMFFSSSLSGIITVFQYYKLQINTSSSMPQHLWLTHVGDKILKRGDYVVIKFHDFRMKNYADFEYVVKQIGGIGGDEIIVRDWNGSAGGISQPNKTSLIYILPNGSFPTFDILSGNHFTPLTKANMIIPNGCYFVNGQHHPSFDSRYKEFGVICDNQIYGKTHPIF
ncbi:MAG: S26 family signal peptidase, partial [Burkholderiales bacterium]|nr:S26 family signal peptidase [Burkholderiales bacterium]